MIRIDQIWLGTQSLDGAPGPITQRPEPSRYSVMATIDIALQHIVASTVISIAGYGIATTAALLVEGPPISLGAKTDALKAFKTELYAFTHTD